MSEDDDLTVARVDWLDEELAQGGALAELRRLAHRARLRWGRTLLLTLVVTGLGVGMAAGRPRLYASRAVFRIPERDLDAEPTASGNGRLRADVAQLVFSPSRLLTVVKEQQLDQPLAQRDPSRAVDELRDALEIEVWRDDLGAPARTGEPTRSARVAVTYRGRDRVEVYAVVHKLGRLLGGGWELLDGGHVEPAGMSRDLVLAILGGVLFVLALPLAGIAVGALDPRIYDLADVERLGLPTVGKLRRFDGDNAGALVERLRRAPPPADGGRGRMGSS
ncbi:MAG: hypothetical protein JWN44_2564 [Myxococcales bacterium]|nr:hypothetical protein [Myxococcales bacterium]